MKFKLAAIAFLVLMSGAVHAASYYFSSSSGNDLRSAAAAKSPATPWKSIGKLNTLLTVLQPGDSVLLKRGDVFYGTITISRSGTRQQPIVLSAYGSGAKPVVTTMVKLTEWKNAGAGVWQGHHTLLGPVVNFVALDGEPAEIGRFPNSNAANSGYINITAAAGDSSVTGVGLKAAPNWAGAEVVIRKDRWTIERCPILAHTNATLHYTSPSGKEAKPGYGFFIQNHLKTLDREGEWFYDSSSQTLSVYMGSTTPAKRAIEVATADQAITMVNSSFWVVNGLRLRGGNQNVFRLDGGEGVTVDDCEIQCAGLNGVYVTGHARFTLMSSDVRYCHNIGVLLPGSSSNPIIEKNRIADTGLSAGMGAADGTGGIGVRCYGKGAVIKRNRIVNSGYNGLAIKLKGCVVQENLIQNFCLVKDDGAGIYSRNSSNKACAGAKISSNTVLNGVGAPNGTNTTGSSAEGIYLDDNSNNVQVLNNTVSKCHRGLYLHNARNIAVVGNTFFDNDVQLAAKHDKNGDLIRGLKSEQNILLAKTPAQLVLQVETRRNDIDSMGTFNMNYYARPLDDDIVIATSYKRDDRVKIKEQLSLSAWQKKYAYDQLTLQSPVQLAGYHTKERLGENMFENGSFRKDVRKVFAKDCTVAWADQASMDSGYAIITPTAIDSYITMNVGALDPNKQYVLKFSAIGHKEMSIGAFLRQGSAPYRPVTPAVYRTMSDTRGEHEIFFSPTESHASGTLVFQVSQAEEYCLDNVQLYEVSATVYPPDSLFRFEFNATDLPKNLRLNESYRDIYNNTYTSQLRLAPYTSLVLIKSPPNDGKAPYQGKRAPLTGRQL